ncbi:MAG: hypothetical protein ABH830_03315 [Patescibacteria group bacterium]
MPFPPVAGQLRVAELVEISAPFDGESISSLILGVVSMGSSENVVAQDVFDFSNSYFTPP